MKLTGENLQLGEKPVPMPLCPPQISHGLDLGSNPGLRGEKPATNRLSYGTANFPLRFSNTYEKFDCNVRCFGCFLTYAGNKQIFVIY
jgi:hypothetical protein